MNLIKVDESDISSTAHFLTKGNIFDFRVPYYQTFCIDLVEETDVKTEKIVLYMD